MPESRTTSVERGDRIRVVAGERRVGQRGYVRRVYTYKRPVTKTWVYAVMDDGGTAGFLSREVEREVVSA
jgi:ribosomal protein L24